MKNKIKRTFCFAVIMLATFTIWTALIRIIDVKAIGPNGSEVGFASLNRFFHNLTGVNMTLYNITDWLGLVPIAFCFGFAVLGIIQWIKRKNILKVDYDILALGVFYIVTIAAYILFEMYAINYRPILINGYLEASYPSSTTLLVLCVMPTAIIQFSARIKNILLRRCINWAIISFMIFMVIGRLISGVHWLSDIIGSILLCTGLVMLYYSVCKLTYNKN